MVGVPRTLHLHVSIAPADARISTSAHLTALNVRDDDHNDNDNNNNNDEKDEQRNKEDFLEPGFACRFLSSTAPSYEPREWAPARSKQRF